MEWRTARYLVLDTETTGLDPSVDRLVEVAATPVTPGSPDGPVGVAKSTLINPERDIPATASAVHHLTARHVAHAPTWAEVAPLIVAEMEAADVLVAHNAPFDRAFLPPVDRPWLDTLRLARHLWPEAPKHSNQVLRYWLPLDVDVDLPHRAADDTYVTAALLIRALASLPPEVGPTVADLLAWVARPVWVGHMTFGKHQGQPITELPRDYLQWLLFKATFPLDPDLRYTLEQVWAGTRPV